MRQIPSVIVLAGGDPYADRPRSKVIPSLPELTAEENAKFEAVVDLGGEGVEPSLYLFAEDAIKVVRRALEIARAYTSSG